MPPKNLNIKIKNKTNFRKKKVVNIEVRGQRNKKIKWDKAKEAINYLVNQVGEKQPKFTLNINALLPTGDVSIISQFMTYNKDSGNIDLDDYSEYLEGKVKDTSKFTEADVLSISFMY